MPQAPVPGPGAGAAAPGPGNARERDAAGTAAATNGPRIPFLLSTRRRVVRGTSSP
eukprot:CAMPEP_0174314940 /NCGR_PEP_ID=MMETSP0810-20121108/5957_1 /TAXON_ID=73025 ORGANISM="Eutreptiella gymnastica-like, Strain CCMP1594" /NCGR_SAMPLE_ID=MMETSP0810 /ASSEMBLY_ACC=CAM_ASM_000659 /LENGTH=55 /DNA_ID=CAMNT_0015424165 /DNA_START=340 /DNA_END=508 /DNA_ORIENTATION=+